MSTLGKQTKTLREGVDRQKLYPLQEAVKMVKERAKAKFDETIEVAMNLGLRVPTSSAPKTWSSGCRGAISTSTASSPRPT